MKEMQEDAAQVDNVVVPDLSGLVGFSYEDLIYNAGGRQSPAQQRQVTRRLVRHTFGIAFGLAFMGGFIALGARLVPAIGAVFLLIGVIKLIRDARESWKGEVAQVDGDLQTGEGEDDYHALIAGWKLEITKEAYQTLIPGGPYRIYFIAGPNQVVGGQVLAGWGPSPPPKKKKGWFSGLSIEIG